MDHIVLRVQHPAKDYPCHYACLPFSAARNIVDLADQHKAFNSSEQLVMWMRGSPLPLMLALPEQSDKECEVVSERNLDPYQEVEVSHDSIDWDGSVFVWQAQVPYTDVVLETVPISISDLRRCLDAGGVENNAT